MGDNTFTSDNNDSYYTGNYTDQSIQRVAKSMNMTKVLRQKLVPQYKDWCVLNVLFLILSMKFFVSDDSVTKEVLGHRKADWSQQLHILVKDIQVN